MLHNHITTPLLIKRLPNVIYGDNGEVKVTRKELWGWQRAFYMSDALPVNKRKSAADPSFLGSPTSWLTNS